MKRRKPPRTRPAETALEKPTSNLWIYCGLALATIAIYSRAFGFDFINYDDPVYVTANEHVRGGLTWAGLKWAFTSIYDGNWFPLTWLSHMLDCQLFGLKSGYHHLTNLIIHTCSTFLLFAVLTRITGARWRSAFVAFAFALHPLHIESVAWIAERKDVLNAFFWMLTLLAYVCFAERRTPLRYLFVLISFCFGLMSKPMIVTLPFALLLLDFWPLRRWGQRTMVIVEKLPLIALSAAVSIVTYLAQRQGGSVIAADQLSLGLRLNNAVISLSTYLFQFFWPSHLSIFYPYSTPQSWYFVIAALVLIGVTVFVVTRSDAPYLFSGWFWYLGTLVPVIGLVQVGLQSHADRYTYIPMIGISIMLACGAVDAMTRWSWSRNAVASVGVAACLVWAAATWTTLGYWRNSVSIFEHAVSVTEGNYVAYTNLGIALKETRRLPDAMTAYQSAARIHPDDATIRDNLGELQLEMGQIEDAKRSLTEALRLKPDYSKAHVDLASVYVRLGQMNEAENEYMMALKVQPDNTEAHYGIGGVFLREGRLAEAKVHFDQAIPALIQKVNSNPDVAETHYNLGVVYGILGRSADAIQEFNEAVRLQPDDPEFHFNLGTALRAGGRVAEAVDQFATAIRLRPDYVNAHLSLAKALESLGRRDEAVAEYSQVLQLAPDFVDARNSMNRLLQK